MNRQVALKRVRHLAEQKWTHPCAWGCESEARMVGWQAQRARHLTAIFHFNALHTVL